MPPPTTPAVSTEQAGKPGPCAIVIFGASGDLTRRKLMPALYQLAYRRLLPREFSIVGMALEDVRDSEFRARMRHAVEAAGLDLSAWDAFAAGLFYTAGDFREPVSFARLSALLSRVEAERGTRGNCLFYLAVPPSAIGEIARGLGMAALTHDPRGWRRVVVEKPFGRDLASARELNRTVGEVFREEQIYRIDHYLGKETVQNILVFRFSSGIFEPIWNRRYVDHVQITVAEELGVEHRAAYYEEAGALRDMVQSHMLQLVALTAMEPPVVFEPDAVRDEKSKVFRSIQPFPAEAIGRFAVRGQYGEGVVDGARVPAYRAEPRVNPHSNTETYAALKLTLENWRWAGVPFYLRTGKRLGSRRTEISLHFRQPPFPLFGPRLSTAVPTDSLTLRIQPNEGISLQVSAKRPGFAIRVEPVTMDFSYAEAFGVRSIDAYERLLHDCLIGDSTLFARRDAIEKCWELVQPVLDAWQAPAPDFPNYPSGSRGPREADEMMARDGRCWNPIPGCGTEPPTAG